MALAQNFPEDLSEIKDLEQLPFQMGTYFRAAMERLTNRLRTLKYNALRNVQMKI